MFLVTDVESLKIIEFFYSDMHDKGDINLVKCSCF